MMPALLLKKMVMGNFDKGMVDAEIADSIDFMVMSVSYRIYYSLPRTLVSCLLCRLKIALVSIIISTCLSKIQSLTWQCRGL